MRRIDDSKVWRENGFRKQDAKNSRLLPEPRDTPNSFHLSRQPSNHTSHLSEAALDGPQFYSREADWAMSKITKFGYWSLIYVDYD